MSLKDLVSTWSTVAGDEVRVVVLPSAGSLLDRLPGALALEADPGPGPQRRLLVGFVPVEGEAQSLNELTAVLGQRDLALLLPRRPLARLPVGPLVSELCRARLRVLSVRPLDAGEGRVALVVTLDPGLPQLSYLYEVNIADDEAAHLRLHNEWALERFALRARDEGLTRRAETAEALAGSLRVERDAARAGLADARTGVTRRSMTVRAKSAVRVIGEHPWDGIKRVGRAVAKRLRG